MLVLLLLTATVIHQQEENNIFQVHTDFGCKIQDFLRVSSRMVAQINRKIGKSGLRELVKIGNFVLKNRRKIGKSIVLFLTKIDSLHHIRVIIKATVIHQQEENNIFQVHTDFGCKIQDFLRVSSRMVAQINRKIGKSGLRELVKIGNFVLKNRRKIGKSIVLFLTKIDSLHHIRVIIKATSRQLQRLQDLDQLSQAGRHENDQ